MDALGSNARLGSSQYLVQRRMRVIAAFEAESSAGGGDESGSRAHGLL